MISIGGEIPLLGGYRTDAVTKVRSNKFTPLYIVTMKKDKYIWIAIALGLVAWGLIIYLASGFLHLPRV